MGKRKKKEERRGKGNKVFVDEQLCSVTLERVIDCNT